MKEIEKALDRYVNHHIRTGSFLEAVLSNDLFGACRKADFFNCDRIFTIAHYIYNNLPPESYGSPEAVKNWLENREVTHGCE